MDSFDSYLLRKAYEKLSRLGDRLAKIDSAIDWEAFRPIIKAMYRNDTRARRGGDGQAAGAPAVVRAGRRGDGEAGRQPSRLPALPRAPRIRSDSTTIWQFRERLTATGANRLVWAELQ